MSMKRNPVRILWTLLAVSVLQCAGAVEKQRVEHEADLPRFSYTVTGPLETLVRDPVAFDRLAGKIRADIESVLDQYEIADKAALRQRLGSLLQLDFLSGHYDAVLARAEAIRALEEKPADKLLSGLRVRAMALAAQQSGAINSPAYFDAVGRSIKEQLDPLPFAVIANEIRAAKAGAEIMGEGLILGSLRDRLQPVVDKNGALSSDLAPALINIRYALVAGLPLKSVLVRTYTDYLDQHKIEKADIWAARNVALPSAGSYTPVRVAIWDSGVDSSLYPGKLLTDASGKPVEIAYDLQARPTTGELFPIPAPVQPKLPELLGRIKGFSDLQSNIDSPEASEVKQFLSSLKPEEFKAMAEQLGLTGNYIHGTHVAGIASEGNPWVRLLIARISFGYTLLPDPCPSQELSDRGVAEVQAVVDFFRRNQVRVVNMSWGGSLKSFEHDLELCGIGNGVEERRVLARKYFDEEKNALTKAFASAPEILFITAAGNSNENASFAETVPAGIVLPNLLTVGAVDKAGDEAPFTSYGPTVLVHANGYQVESFLPGGKRVALSGTSMASPNAANLAAKILAVRPNLKPTEVIAIIRNTADTSADGRRTLINPAKALASLAAH